MLQRLAEGRRPEPIYKPLPQQLSRNCRLQFCTSTVLSVSGNIRTGRLQYRHGCRKDWLKDDQSQSINSYLNTRVAVAVSSFVCRSTPLESKDSSPELRCVPQGPVEGRPESIYKPLPQQRSRNSHLRFCMLTPLEPADSSPQRGCLS